MAWINAAAYVTLGCAIPLKCYEAVYGPSVAKLFEAALPLLMMIAGLVGTIGAMIGMNYLGGSVDEKAFWTSREKWEAMHYFATHGYYVTKKGWAEDVFQLKSGLCFYEKVHKIHAEYLATRDAATKVSVACQATEDYIRNLEKARTEHFDQLEIQKLLDQGDLYQFDANIEHKETYSFWDDADDVSWKREFQVFFALILVACFYALYYGFYTTFELQKSVRDGIESLDQHWGFWALFGGYFVFQYFYVWMSSGFSTSYFSMDTFTACCSSKEAIPEHIELETLFETYEWLAPEEKFADEENRIVTEALNARLAEDATQIADKGADIAKGPGDEQTNPIMIPKNENKKLSN
jgi:hypothetical protein